MTPADPSLTPPRRTRIAIMTLDQVWEQGDAEDMAYSDAELQTALRHGWYVQNLTVLVDAFTEDVEENALERTTFIHRIVTLQRVEDE